VIRNTNDADFDAQNDWIYVSNFGGWRNMGPWHWEADDEVTMLDMLATMPFNNAILLFEMQGNDLLTLLNMEASGNAALAPPEFDLNGGQPVVVTGATRGERVDDFEFGGVTRPRYAWYFANGERISDDDTVYRVIGSNFIWGGLGANGGDRFPFPGNNHGDALGMTFISQPLALLVDGSLVPWPEVPTDSTIWEEFGLMLLRDAMIETTQFRAAGFQQAVTLPATVADLEAALEAEAADAEAADDVLLAESDNDQNDVVPADEVDFVVTVTVLPAPETEVVVPVSAPAGTGTVTAGALHVRAGGGVEYAAIGHVRRGDVVTVLETTGRNFIWHRIQFGELTGWVFGGYLQLN